MTRSTISAALCAATLLLAPSALAQGGGGSASPTTGGGGGATDSPSSSPAPPCIVPHVERGAAVGETRRALRRSGCSTATRRVRSSVERGRVVSLSAREGARLKATRKVVIRVSDGR